MTSEQQETDVVIIGAGPVGLFAIFEVGMMKMSCHVVDTLDAIGGQCIALYPEKPIFDIPAQPKIDGQDLIRNLQEQAAPFEPVYHLGQQVTGFEKLADERFRVTTSTGTHIVATAVIIAAGCGAFGPNRPPLDGIEAYEDQGPGAGVHYMVTRREDFRDKHVVIAGGGDSAVDWALSLADVAASLKVVHRRPKFRAAPESVTQLQSLHESGALELVVPYQLRGLSGTEGRLEGVVVATLDGEERTLQADALLPFYGLSMELGPIADWGLNLEKSHIAVDPSTQQTSISGVYAIGDICSYGHKLKLILQGFSEAAVAAHDIYPRVHPDTAYHFEYSTTSGVPA